MATVTVCGQHCGSNNLVRNGRENSASNGYTEEHREEIIRLCQE